MDQQWPLWAASFDPHATTAVAPTADALEVFTGLLLCSRSHPLAARLDACLSLFLWEASPAMVLEEVMICVSLILAGLSRACGVPPPPMQERLQIAVGLHTEAMQLQTAAFGEVRAPNGSPTQRPLHGVYLLRALMQHREFIDFIERATSDVDEPEGQQNDQDKLQLHSAADTHSRFSSAPSGGFRQSALLSFMPLKASPADRRRLQQRHELELIEAKQRREQEERRKATAAAMAAHHSRISAYATSSPSIPSGFRMFDGSFVDQYQPFFAPFDEPAQPRPPPSAAATVKPSPTALQQTPMHPTKYADYATRHANSAAVAPSSTLSSILQLIALPAASIAHPAPAASVVISPRESLMRIRKEMSPLASHFSAPTNAVPIPSVARRFEEEKAIDLPPQRQLVFPHTPMQQQQPRTQVVAGPSMSLLQQFAPASASASTPSTGAPTSAPAPPASLLSSFEHARQKFSPPRLVRTLPEEAVYVPSTAAANLATVAASSSSMPQPIRPLPVETTSARSSFAASSLPGPPEPVSTHPPSSSPPSEPVPQLVEPASSAILDSVAETQPPTAHSEIAPSATPPTTDDTDVHATTTSTPAAVSEQPNPTAIPTEPRHAEIPPTAGVTSSVDNDTPAALVQASIPVASTVAAPLVSVSSVGPPAQQVQLARVPPSKKSLVPFSRRVSSFDFSSFDASVEDLVVESTMHVTLSPLPSEDASAIHEASSASFLPTASADPTPTALPSYAVPEAAASNPPTNTSSLAGDMSTSAPSASLSSSPRLSNPTSSAVEDPWSDTPLSAIRILSPTSSPNVATHTLRPEPSASKAQPTVPTAMLSASEQAIHPSAALPPRKPVAIAPSPVDFDLSLGFAEDDADEALRQLEM